MSARLALLGAVAFAALICPLTCTGALAQSARSVAPGTVNAQELVSRLRPLLNASKKGAIVYYDGVCSAQWDGRIMSFPGAVLGKVDPGEGGISAIRSMFPKANVEERLGVISIKLGFVPTDLLVTKIGSLPLGPMETYDGFGAVMAIERSPDVAAGMRRLGYGFTIEEIDRLVQTPFNGLPHLPATLTNLTLEQALGQVAKTFRAIVLVGTCKDKRRIQMDEVGSYDWTRDLQSSG